MTDMNHLEHLRLLADQDVSHILEKEKTYQGSWKKSGGRSAWFMLQRKIDRLLNMMARPKEPDGWTMPDVSKVVYRHDDMVHLVKSYTAENIFAKIQENASGDDGTVLAEIRDLRRYLLLVEAEMVARGVVVKTPSKLDSVFTPGTPEDGGHHEPKSSFSLSVDTNEPWLLTNEVFSSLSIEAKKVLDPVYVNYGSNMVLVPAISVGEWNDIFNLTKVSVNGDFLYDVSSCYVVISDGDFCVLAINEVPEGERDRWPYLQRELNNKEHEMSMDWVKPLYDWHQSVSKWIIKKQWTAWVRS